MMDGQDGAHATHEGAQQVMGGAEIERLETATDNEFWKSLREIARERGETLYQLVGSIDAERKFCNLSSAIRMFILQYYRDELELRGGAIISLDPSKSIEVRSGPLRDRPFFIESQFLWCLTAPTSGGAHRPKVGA